MCSSRPDVHRRCLTSWSLSGLSNLWDISGHGISSHCDLLCGGHIQSTVTDWIGLNGQKVSTLMTDSVTRVQTNNLSGPLICFVVDWTPTVHGTMLIFGSGAYDCRWRDLYLHWIQSLFACVISVEGRELRERHSGAVSSGSQCMLALSECRRLWNAPSSLRVRINTLFWSGAPPRVNTLLHHKSWIHG